MLTAANIIPEPHRTKLIQASGGDEKTLNAVIAETKAVHPHLFRDENTEAPVKNARRGLSS